MRQIIYSDKALKKLTGLDPAFHGHIRIVLETYRWDKFHVQTSWLRFVYNFRSRGGNNFRVLCEAVPEASVIKILDIVIERGLYTVLR